LNVNLYFTAILHTSAGAYLCLETRHFDFNGLIPSPLWALMLSSAVRSLLIPSILWKTSQWLAQVNLLSNMRRRYIYNIKFFVTWHVDYIALTYFKPFFFFFAKWHCKVDQLLLSNIRRRYLYNIIFFVTWHVDHIAIAYFKPCFSFFAKWHLRSKGHLRWKVTFYKIKKA